MDYLYEKVAYLKGLADGLDLDETTKEGKMLVKIVETLEDFADAIVDLDEEVEELNEFVEIIDEDLSDLEDFVYDEEFYDDEFDEFDEFECPKCGTILFVDEDDFDEFGNLEIACPECGEEYTVTDDDVCDCVCGCREEESEEE
ncbi:hypothetical protein EZV73_14545 [Acidaminobacter sp. JC074]|uniref:CD1247 N-terminal domain-containing protein n=1 Tax=Acidaminobacter sp. JC074 TaxID=2530199 RepID=UPI001F0CFE88|nr:CD1247 N-terminal domain-containing protein [Acidaminobacter sp. JC074]MCH4888811.1 hypothetical protein [Acidaminobacter sp. JC074]